MSVSIHPSSVVDENAELGEGVTVGPFSVVGPNVKIGDRCEIRSHVVLDGHTTLGSENVVFQFASVGSIPQDLKFQGEPSTLVIGDKNVIREYVTLQPGTKGGHMTTTIGNQNLFMACSHVGHDCVVGDGNVFANSAALAGHVTVGNKVILGGLAAVHQFCNVGDFSFLAGGTMAGNDIPPYSVAYGYPAHLRAVNVVGLQRDGYSEGDISSIKKAYRHLFLKRGSLESKVESLDADLKEAKPVQILIQSIERSERGFCPPNKSLGDA